MTKKKDSHTYSSLSGASSSFSWTGLFVGLLVVAGIVVTITVVTTKQKHHGQVEQEPKPPPPTHLIVIDNYDIFTPFLLGMIDLWRTIILYDTEHVPVLNITVYNATSTMGDFGPELDVWSIDGDHFVFVSNGSLFNNTSPEFLVNVTLTPARLRRLMTSSPTEVLVHLGVRFRYDLARFLALLVRESDYTLWPNASACHHYCTGGETYCHPYHATPGYYQCIYDQEMHNCQDCCDSRCDPSNFTCTHPVPRATCDESIGGNRTCVCHEGFWTNNGTGQDNDSDDDDYGVCLDIDECDQDPPICGNRSEGFECWNSIGSYECIPCRFPALADLVAGTWAATHSLYVIDERCNFFTAFVLPVPSARLGGRDGASKLCQEEANRNGLRGMFVAALSTSEESVAQFLQRSGQTYLSDWAYTLPDRSVIAFDRRGFMPGLNATGPGLPWEGQLLGTRFDMLANGSTVSEDLSLPYPLLLSGSDPFDPPEPFRQLLAHEQFGSTCADWTSDSGNMRLVGGYLRYWSEFCNTGYPWCWSRRLVLDCDGKNGTGFVPVITNRDPMTLQMYIPCVSVADWCVEGTFYGNDSHSCEPYDECEFEWASYVCTNAELGCIDEIDGYTCNCSSPARAFDFNTQTCQPYNACTERQDPCPFFSNCSHTTLEPYICSEGCLDGFSGPDCLDVNECLSEDNCPSADNGFTCLNTLGSFSCDPCRLPSIGELNITANLSEHCFSTHVFLQPLDTPELTLMLGDGVGLDQICQFMAETSNRTRDNRAFRAFTQLSGQLPFNLSMDTPLVDVDGSVWLWAAGDLATPMSPRVWAFDRLVDGTRDDLPDSEVHLVITDIDYYDNASIPTLTGGDCSSSWNTFDAFGHVAQFVVGVAEHWDVFGDEGHLLPWVNVAEQGCLLNAPSVQFGGKTIHYSVYCVEMDPEIEPAPEDVLHWFNWADVFAFPL